MLFSCCRISPRRFYMRQDVYEAVCMAKKNSKKINYAAYSRQYGCDPRTVKRYFEGSSRELATRKERRIDRKTDKYKGIIEEKFLKYHAPAKAIFLLLRDRYGYDGSYSTIKRHVQKLREDEQEKATVRFETRPGLQCQIDWKESLRLENDEGEEFEVNIFLSVLGYSRLKYIELTADKTQTTLFRCLANCISYFKGVPKEFLFDNMRTVVDFSRTQFAKPVYNETFAQFAKDANFEPRSCLAYRPETKGKVESVARLMNRLKAFNKEFHLISELDAIVRRLNEEINAEVCPTTMEMPRARFEKEKEYLSPEPDYNLLRSYFCTKPLVRKVSKEAMVTFENARYSVDPKLIGRHVTLEKDGDTLRLFHDNRLVCSHKVAGRIFNYIPEHYMLLMSSSLSDKDTVEERCRENLSLYDRLTMEG